MIGGCRYPVMPRRYQVRPLLQELWTAATLRTNAEPERVCTFLVPIRQLPRLKYLTCGSVAIQVFVEPQAATCCGRHDPSCADRRDAVARRVPPWLWDKSSNRPPEGQSSSPRVRGHPVLGLRCSWCPEAAPPAQSLSKSRRPWSTAKRCLIGKRKVGSRLFREKLHASALFGLCFTITTGLVRTPGLGP
jgi:hypothetical protein